MTAEATSRTEPGGNRWLILVGSVLLQLAIGAVYAWSTFAKALQADASAFDISPVQASLPFQTCIGMIFVGAFLGGRIQDEEGPRCSSSATACSAASVSAWPTSCRSPCCRSGSRTSGASSPVSRSPASASVRSSPRRWHSG